MCLPLGFYVNSHPKESDLIICTSISSKILCHMISVRTGGTVWAVCGEIPAQQSGQHTQPHDSGPALPTARLGQSG